MNDLIQPEPSLDEYRALAEFRYQIRKFLHFSEEQARLAGIEPQQHQLMLAIKGLPDHHKPTIRELASRLQLKHHSVVELVDRLANRGAVMRTHHEEDRREVIVGLTPFGEEILRKLSILHKDELEKAGPALTKALRAVTQRVKANRTDAA